MKTNLLKSIFISLILLVGATNAWAYDQSAVDLYFDNSTAKWTNCYVYIGHGSYTSCYAMSRVSGTQYLWKLASNFNGGKEWGGASGWVVSSEKWWDNSKEDVYKFVYHGNNKVTNIRTSVWNATTIYKADGTQSVTHYSTSCTVYKWATSTKSDYTVTINSATGGTLTVKDYDNNTVSNGASKIHLTVLKFSATASTGYTFGGVQIKNGSATTTISAADIASKTYTLTSNVTITPIWTPNTYTITYKDQGGGAFSGTHETDAPTQHTYGTATNLKTATKTGYTFGGWFTSSDCTGSAVTTLGATAYTAAITLYAKWTAKTSTVTLNQQYGEGGDTQTTATFDSEMPTINLPTRSGYVFGGYYIDLNNEETKYYNADGSSAKNWDKEGEQTLQAKWTAMTYYIKFDGNGATSGDMENQKFTYQESQNLSENKFIKTGYTFQHWNTKSDNSGTPCIPGEQISNKFVPTKEGEVITLYAIWHLASYEITYTAPQNGSYTIKVGSLDPVSSNINSTYGTTITLTASPSSGYKFAGWEVTTENGGKVSVENNQFTMPDASVTVQANFSPISYSIQFNANGGEGTMSPQKFTYGTAQNLTANSFTRTGYTFAGWNTKADGTGTSYTDKLSVNNLTATNGATLTLYAQWEAKTITITWNLNDGSGNTTTSQYTYNGAVMELPTPTRDGYNFEGWWTAQTGGTKITDVGATNKPADNVTYYAQWSEKQYERYTITYNLNGGTNSTDNPEYYNEVTPDIVLKDAGKIGYTFLGWYENANFTGNPVTQISIGSTGNKTLYAKWEERTLLLNHDFWEWEDWKMSHTVDEPAVYTTNGNGVPAKKVHFQFKNSVKEVAYDWTTISKITGSGWLKDSDITQTNGQQTIEVNLTRKSDLTITLTLLDPFDETKPSVNIHANPYYNITIDGTTYELQDGDNMPSFNTQQTPAGYAFKGYYTQTDGKDVQLVDANGKWIANVDGYIKNSQWNGTDDITLYAHFEKAQISITLDKEVFESGINEDLTVSYTIDPQPAGTVIACWELCYSNGNPVAGHEPVINNDVVTFPLAGISVGTYKVVATLRLNDCSGEEVSKAEAIFVVAGTYTVTIKYTCDGEQIAASTAQEGHPTNLTKATAPEIGGYNFVKWVLGDGITSTSTLTDKTISYTANYDGYLTATYKKKDLIFLDISTLPNKAQWKAPHVYLYKEGGYWSEEKGTGSKSGGNFITDGAMTKVQGTTDIWYYEYAGVENFGGVVAFTSVAQSGYENFAKCEVIYRKDFTSGTPVFVPAAGQKAVDRNTNSGQTAQYYSEGYWVKYMGRTGYSLLIYNKAGDTELMRQDFTSDNLRMSMKAIINLEANHTYKYEVLRDNDYYYKNSGTLTTNNKGPVKLNSKDKGSIKTTESGNYVFTLDYVLDNNEGDLQLSVDYPVTVGDYRVLYKDKTRATYKPSQIIKADETNPIVGYFVRPGKNPELKVQSAARISDEGVTWYNSDNEIFFKPNNNWKSDGARFAAYFYNNSKNEWVDLKANGDLYSCVKPTTNAYTHVIFCRMNSATKENNWDNKWNQTDGLTIPTNGNNLYSLVDGVWGKDSHCSKVYLKPNANWKTGNARFAAYFYKEENGNKTEKWHSMIKEGNLYWCDVPNDCNSKVIFCRMKGDETNNIWDNKWDQTNDLDVPTNDKTLYTIAEGAWNKGDGSWSAKEDSWSTISASIIDLTKDLTTKLTEIEATSDAVYTIYLSKEGTSIEKVVPYTGNYYIRVDAADGKWYDYKNNKDNLMTYSAFSESNANSFGEKFSHYKTAWCTKGTNVKFVIANDYSLCISDTLIQDEGNPFSNIDEHGNLKDEDKYSANIRFMWNRKDNKVSRAYVAGADEKKEFLVLKANQPIKDEQGNAITDNKAIFEDTQNWIYEHTIQLKPGTRVRLYACYPDVNEAEAQYFSGEYNTTWDDKNSTSLLTGSDGTEYAIRVIYDFKTNRLMTAWIPSHTIDNTLALNADMMIVREHQENAQSIVFAKSENQLTEIKTVYGTLRLNRWILNNRGGADNLKVESCTIEEDGGHRKYDEEVTNENHAPLPLAEQKSLYERALYFISFPFDVHLSDVFGFGTYGTHWVISKYNGLRRAQNGYFIDNCVNEDCTNWDYIWDPDEFVMKANEGYLLSLDLDLMKYNNIDFWKNNRATVELYFPSRENVKTIGQTDYTMDGLGEEYLCQKNYNTNGDKPDSDRKIKDSYWRCIGVPSFADYSGELTDGREPIVWTADQNAFPFLYEWNTIDNSLVARSTSNFEFRSTFAYLVQNGNEIHWTAVNTKPNPIIARETVANVNYEWKITLQSKEEVVDHTYIRMTSNEEVTYEFDFNQDLVKELNYGRADIYTMIGYERVAANSLPLSENTTVVSLGLDIETAGDYTIAMPEGVMSVGVTLYDAETGTRTNLSAGMEYTIALNKGVCDNRLYLEISPIQNDAPTDIENIGDGVNNGETVKKYLIDGKLIIRTAEGIFDAQGHRL